MTLPAFKLKRQQLLVATLLGLLLVLGLGVIFWSVDEEIFEEDPNETAVETEIATAGDNVNPQEIWVERMESEHKLTAKKLDALQEALMAHMEKADQAKEEVKRLEAQIESHRAHPPESLGSLDSSQEIAHDPHLLPLPFPSSERQPLELSQALPQPTGVRKIVLNLSHRKKRDENASPKLTIENTVPAGTFAKAVLLGGVDASTSISAQSDPRPVLLRVTDHGNLPRKFQSDLKACHVLASSYGDLSSERVYMRLEKLTCTERLTGEISETQVAGYVVGEDGRAGVRGVVADRAGPLVRNSLMGGFLSGMGHFFGAQQQRSVFPVSPFGQTKALDPQQMLTSGLANGASSALEKYAEFFIQRAEQLQPVLQVAAGRAVDIVFTEGSAFGETQVRETLTKIRDRSRRDAIQKLEGQADKGAWLPHMTAERN